MAQFAPPQPPHLVTLADDDRLDRVRFHLWQILASLITVVVTVWIILLGSPILSIVALAVAKHVLVAILVMGLHIYPTRVEDTPSSS